MCESFASGTRFGILSCTARRVLYVAGGNEASSCCDCLQCWLGEPHHWLQPQHCYSGNHNSTQGNCVLCHMHTPTTHTLHTRMLSSLWLLSWWSLSRSCLSCRCILLYLPCDSSRTIKPVTWRTTSCLWGLCVERACCRPRYYSVLSVGRVVIRDNLVLFGLIQYCFGLI